MADDMNAFEEKFCGVWKWDRDENLKEAMTKMKYPEKEIEMYCSMKPTIYIERRGDEVYMKFDMGSNIVHDCQFKFGEEFETKDNLMNSFHNKEIATFKDGVIIFEARTQLTGPGKCDTYSEFIIKDGELHSPMSPLGDKSFNGNRIYKRA